MYHKKKNVPQIQSEKAMLSSESDTKVNEMGHGNSGRYSL